MKSNIIIDKLKTIEILLIFIIALLITLLTLVPGLKDIESRKSMELFYGASDLYDYALPSPAHDQIPTIAEMTFVDKIIPFYETSISYGDKQVKLIISDSDSKYFGPFVASTTHEGNAGNAWVDATFARESNLSLGSRIDIAFKGIPISLIVRGISSGDFGDVPTIGISLKDFDCSIVENVSYSGAYLYSNDNKAAEKYLMEKYKPFGKLDKKDRYSSVDQYEMHKQAIENADYSLEILDIKSLGDNKLSAIPSYNSSYGRLAIGILCSVVFIVVFVSGKISASDVMDKILRMKRIGVETNTLIRIFNHLYLKVIMIYLFISVCLVSIAALMRTNVLNGSYVIILLVVFAIDFVLGQILNRLRAHKIMDEYKRIKEKGDF